MSQAQEGHILSGGLDILLIGLAVISPLFGPLFNGSGVMGISFSLVIVYGVGARLLARFQSKRGVEVLKQEAVQRHYDQISRARTSAPFAMAGLVIVLAGVWLGSIADRIAAEIGLGLSFVGAFFLGVGTSLPEIAASLAAVRMGAIDLAIGNVLGRHLFSMTVLAVYDIFDGPKNLWASMSDANALVHELGWGRADFHVRRRPGAGVCVELNKAACATQMASALLYPLNPQTDTDHASLSC